MYLKHVSVFSVPFGIDRVLDFTHSFAWFLIRVSRIPRFVDRLQDDSDLLELNRSFFL